MSNSLRAFWILLFVIGSGMSAAVAQESFANQLSGVTNAVQPWDYRFDAQFQSTLKPEVRWYFRANPAVPGTRYLPQDFGFGLDYGYAAPRAITGPGQVEFYSTYPDQYGVPAINANGEQASLYWNHLRYLRDTFGQTPIVRRDGSRTGATLDRYRGDEDSILDPFEFRDPSFDYDGNPDDTTPLPVPLPVPETASRTAPYVTRPVWIHRDNATGSVSVLYRKPAAHADRRFYAATARLSFAAKIIDLKWHERPEWLGKIQLAGGRLTSRQ